MKLVILFIYGLILVKSQHILYYPQQFNYPIYNQDKFIPAVSWDRFITESFPKEIPHQDTNDENYEPNLRANFFSNQDDPSPRFLLNNRVNNFLIGGNTNFALKTFVYTTVKTKTVFTTSLCIPSSNVIARATTCARRKRNMEGLLFDLQKFYSGFTAPETLEPSPTLKVETTVRPTRDLELLEKDDFSEIPAVSSSKMDAAELENSVIDRSKRFLNAARYTYTSWKFTTSTVGQPVNIRFLLAYAPCAIGNVAPPLPNLVCALGCIPPGYSVCSSSTR